MFDERTYSKEFIKAKKRYDMLNRKFVVLGAEGNKIEQDKLIPRINKAYEEYAKEHNKWCDKYGYTRLKIH